MNRERSTVHGAAEVLAWSWLARATWKMDDLEALAAVRAPRPPHATGREAGAPGGNCRNKKNPTALEQSVYEQNVEHGNEKAVVYFDRR
jgi:hypothetical protein